MLTGRFNKDTKFDKTDFRSSIPRFQGENLKHNIELVEYVEDLAKKKETSPARIALGWLLAQKPWIVPIPGTKRIERIEENIGGADIQFTSEELADIRCHLDNIEIVGERYPEDQEKMTDFNSREYEKDNRYNRPRTGMQPVRDGTDNRQYG